MNELLAILILIFAARLAGELAVRVNQSPMLGEILAGLVLGPTLFDLIEVTEPIELLSHLGILFLMFLAGLETDLRLIRKVAGKSVIISIVGTALSFGLAYGVGRVFGFSNLVSLFLGGALAASSIVVTARVFDDYGMMRSEIGLLSMATHAIDDVLGMIVILFLASVAGGAAIEAGAGEAARPLWLTGAMLVVYAAVATAVGLWLFRPLMRLVGGLRSEEMYFTIAILLVLLYSWAAEAFGLADVLGAFLAGAFLHYTEEAEPSMIIRVEAIAAGFLVPIFFASMGLETDLRALVGVLPLLGTLLLVATVGKLVGCGITAKLTGYSSRDSYILGAGMVPRAEMTLVVLGIGMAANVLPEIMPPLLVSVVFLSALITSPLLRPAVKGMRRPRIADEHAVRTG